MAKKITKPRLHAKGKVYVKKLVLDKFTTYTNETLPGGQEAFGIDPGVVESIYILNSKGYLTTNSCQGHVNERGHGYMQPHVVFKEQQSFSKLPGLKWFLDEHEKTSTRYPYKPLKGKGKGIFSWLQFGSPSFKPKMMNEADFVQARKELLAWAKSLPKAK